MKKVQLNCVYGDTLPGIREFDDDVADKLIVAGHAIEVEDDTPSNIKALKVELSNSQKRINALTKERDEALTALELAKGVSDGKDHKTTT